MELKCPSCDASYDVPETVLSEEGTTVRCPECGSTYTALPSGVTLVSKGGVVSNTPNGDDGADVPPFISGESNVEEKAGKVTAKVPASVSRHSGSGAILVNKVWAEKGDHLSEGEVVAQVVIEGARSTWDIEAPSAGVVDEVLIEEGQQVLPEEAAFVIMTVK